MKDPRQTEIEALLIRHHEIQMALKEQSKVEKDLRFYLMVEIAKVLPMVEMGSHHNHDMRTEPFKAPIITPAGTAISPVFVLYKAKDTRVGIQGWYYKMSAKEQSSVDFLIAFYKLVTAPGFNPETAQHTPWYSF